MDGDRERLEQVDTFMYFQEQSDRWDEAENGRGYGGDDVDEDVAK